MSTQLPAPVDRTPYPYLLGGSLLLLVAALTQRPGSLVSDTKIALAIDPARFLSRALHLWDPTIDSGGVSNQSTGYLMPMGPFFLLTHAIGIPTAWAQRLWLALLLIAGFWGLVRLADALGIGNRLGRFLGGLAYALSPFVLSRAGDNSALLLGALFLPWMLLPLVRVTHTSHLPPAVRACSLRRAAALSGCAVLLAGGINATVTFDAAIPVVLWLALMCRGRRAWALRGWWALAFGCATAWWLVALRMQGTFGIDFVRYTESAATTTSVTSLPETMRGTADWLGFLRLDGQGIPAAWTYISNSTVVAASFALVAFGLIGLCRRHVPARRFLFASLLLGVIAIAAAYPGEPHGLLAGQWRDALSGSLGALRNVIKFQPLLDLPLALGLAHCLPVLSVRRPASGRIRRSLRFSGRAAVALALAAAVVIGATPVLLSRVYPDGSFRTVPKYWQQAATWLNHSATGSRTLLLPATATGAYRWGDPNDEPMMWLSRTDWAVRNLIPLGGVNNTRLLDSIEQQLAQRAAPALAATLARAGIGFVLVRNDLPTSSVDQPPSTDEVHAALWNSGLRRVAHFGPLEPSRPSSIDLLLKKKSSAHRYPALEIYAPAAAPASRVDTYPLGSLAVLSGGPEALPTLQAAGVLGDRPTVTAADLADPAVSGTRLPAGRTPTIWIDTDTLQRRSEHYGTVHGGASYLLTAGSRAAGESEAPQVRLDVNPVGHQTVAEYDGIANVTASNYGFVLQAAAEAGPQAAVDGNPYTAWTVSGFRDHNIGQWWQMTFDKPRDLRTLQVSLLAETRKRSRITVLRVSTVAGSATTRLRNVETPQAVKVPVGSTSWVRLTIEGVSRGTDKLLGPGLREVTFPGLSASQYAALPDDARDFLPASGPTSVTYSFSRDRGDPLAALDADPEQQLSRRFTVPRTENFAVRGTAVALPGFTLPPGSAGGHLDLACGTGPTVTIDGRSYATSLHGPSYDFVTGQPVQMWLCDLQPVNLAAGRHTLVTAPGYLPLRPDTLIITTDRSSPPEQPRSQRAVTITRWGNEKRAVHLAAGPAVVLTVHENFNASWHATLDGKRLQPMRIDGWQQGFVVPAGSGGNVLLTNSPGIALQRELLLSLLLVLLLLAAALIPARRLRRAPAAVRPRPRIVGYAVAAGAAAITVALTAGPLVAAGVAGCVLLAWPLRRLAPILIAAGLAVAAAAEITEPGHFVTAGRGAFGPASQVAVALVLAITVLAAGAWHPSPPEQPPDGTTDQDDPPAG